MIDTEADGFRAKDMLVQKLHPDAILPERKYDDDAGFDLFVLEATTIDPGEFQDVPTGLAIQAPPGIWFQITGRSSTWRKRKLLVIEGIIDHGYRGPIFAAVRNMGDEPAYIDRGERIVQMIPRIQVHLGVEEVFELGPSARGEAGFGSTGR